MRFFKKIWKKIKGLLKKRPPSTEKIISEEKAVLSEKIEEEEIYEKIHETNDPKEKADLIKKIARHKTAKAIIDYVENEIKITEAKKKGRKKLYELHELRIELQILEEKRETLSFAGSQIKPVPYSDNLSFDKRINYLFALLSKNKIVDKVELSDLSISAFDKSFQILERLLTDKSTLKRHKQRESEKQKQEDIYRNKIKQKLSTLETYINQNKLDDARLLLNVISKSIKPNYEKELFRLTKSKEKLKEKELKIFIKQQEELLRKQAEEAQKIKELEERRLEEQRIIREEYLAKQKIEAEKKADKERKLNALLNKKANWREFQKVLQENNITILYHFTDHSNIKSIKENGGLYSWFYCDRNNIVIPMTGNSSLGRSLDLEFGLEDFVRLSFIKDHPMKHVAMNEGRITRPYLLKVSVEVCYFENTRFSNMNAADRRHTIGDSFEFLQSLNFDLFKRSYFDLNIAEKKLHQAEVLVKTWIPLEYITNINDVA